MKQFFQLALAGVVITAPTQQVHAQYRDFRNTQGKSIHAMPWKKTDTGVVVKTNTGKSYTLDYAILSQNDIEFLKAWDRPEYTHSVNSRGGRRLTGTQAEDCFVSIQREARNGVDKDTLAFFKATSEREIELALEMFTGTLRHKETFLQKNAVLGKNYRIDLTAFTKKFLNGMRWSISANDQTLTLSGSGNGAFLNAAEAEAPYLYDYIRGIDADRLVKEFLRREK